MRVLFNASVILAGLYSPKGASGILLKLVEQKKIIGVISVLIFNEVMRHAEKIGFSEKELNIRVSGLFGNVARAPEDELVEKFLKIVMDPGDAHVLASAKSEGCEVLVSLDKKHILSLKGKVMGLRILSPGELLQREIPRQRL